ncbi:MAG: PDZ domain-containing protein [Bryobacteraceae bacterium]|nr:PDZ domain-containing protein [Bryobacteraceae bacterium]
MRSFGLVAFAAVAVLAQGQTEADGPSLFRNPTISKTEVVFEYGGDLWIAPRAGGAARPLTAGPGLEAFPIFSPDGQKVAFTGQYDGSVDVFVVPAAGGVPKRLTWHPGPDQAAAWTPDSQRVIFASGRTANSPRYAELFSISVDGGPETKLPLPVGYEAAFSPDGKKLAYVPMSRAFTAWKRYRGGQTTPVWIAELETSKVERIPRDNSNDFCPMWVGGRVWFLSDREGTVNLFSYDPQSKKVARALENKGWDFKSASAGPDAIVLEQLGQIHLFDVKTGKMSPVKITASGDLAEVRERFVKIGTRLGTAGISPTGVRAVFEGRGEILTVPAEKGDARNLTNTPGVMERYPAWSPDGRWIAYFSDASGEYELHVAPHDGKGDVKKFRIEEKPTFYTGTSWSPDSKKISFIDAHLHLWMLDVDEGKARKIDKDRYWGRPVGASWSPDSKWIAYTKTLRNYMGAVFVHSLADGKSVQVTDGMSDARNPVWDADGKHLYFTASTDSGPAIQPDIQSGARTVTSSVYVVVLSKNDPSPFAPESDEEKAAEEKKADAVKPEGAKPEGVKPDGPKPEAAKAAAKPADVKIDLENILQRVLALPMPPRRYVGLQTGKAGTLFAIEAPLPAPGTPFALNVHRFDMKERRGDVPLTGVNSFLVARNGEKALYRQQNNWTIAPIRPLPPRNAPPGPPPGGPPPTPLKTADLEVKIKPREEWTQMYRDAWRIQREMFYDPGLHGVNVADFEAKYRKFLGNLSSRRDLNYVMQDMMGEVSVGHLGVFGGEQPEVKTVQTGLLGADYEVANGRYRFKRIFNGENWNPGLKAPLTQPGVNVRVGDYLLAVDGRDVTAKESVYSFFEGKAGKQVAIRVGPNADGSGARDVTVEPVPSESGLRNLAWIEENRRKVDKATNGRVAYIYMPDTAGGGLTNFNRYFYAQVGKEAAIIDERYNSGGALATDIVNALVQKPLSRVATRDGEDELQPQGAIYGPKAMIINEWAGSGGDAMPWYFRRAGAGPLIGKRTWGGLVGRAGVPQLMDGGVVTAPSSGVWDPATSKWIAENVGVEPDIEVENDPELVRQGRDPQLEKAIETVMAELAKRPATEPKRPAYPNYQIPGGAPTASTANATRK